MIITGTILALIALIAALVVWVGKGEDDYTQSLSTAPETYSVYKHGSESYDDIMYESKQ